MTSNHAKLAYSVDEAAAASSLSRREIDRAIKVGDLAVKAAGASGGKRLILAADLQAFLEGLPDHEPQTVPLDGVA